jgi:hypothetical protein
VEHDLHAPATRELPDRLGVLAGKSGVEAYARGSLIALLAIAFVFGAWSGSRVALWLLVSFAVVAWLIARTRP